jgi:leucyl-tRNA synthetase
MEAKELGTKSVRSGLKRFFRRSVASPPPAARQVTAMLNPDPDDLTIAEATYATENLPSEARPLESVTLENTTKSSSDTARTQAQPVERQTGDAATTESIEQQGTAYSKSQELWNAAYDSLEEDKDTTELVRNYVKTLITVLGTRLDHVSDADISANLKDVSKRQMFMKKLVEDGQAKISASSNVTRSVGNVAQFILSAKGMVDAAIQNIPQAVLPWAGVCIGLQVDSTVARTDFPVH